MTNLTDRRADSYVLNVVVNDYESLDMIWREASSWAAQEGTPIAREEITLAVLRLVRSGLVQAFRFDAVANQFNVVNVSSVPELEGLWFLATSAGLQRADSEG